MINEIYVIQESGIPIYYYNYDTMSQSVELEDDFYTLQAGFFAAMVQFGSELTKDELRYVVFDNRTYGIKRATDVYIVFSENLKLSVAQLEDLDKKLDVASNYLTDTFSDKNIDIAYVVNEDEMDRIVGNFSNFLVKEKIIEEEGLDNSRVRKTVQNFVFKAVGYEPGKCNIGPKERMQRLTVGMVSIAIGLLIFALALFLEQLNPNFIYLSLLNIIPFFMGFNGIYQYFFKFCVTNALKKQYNMS